MIPIRPLPRRLPILSKILNPSKKTDFIIQKLRISCHFNSVDDIKAQIISSCEGKVPEDLEQLYREYSSKKEILLWCHGKGNLMKARLPSEAALTRKLGLRALKLHVPPVMRFIVRNWMKCKRLRKISWSVMQESIYLSSLGLGTSSNGTPWFTRHTSRFATLEEEGKEKQKQLTFKYSRSKFHTKFTVFIGYRLNLTW